MANPLARRAALTRSRDSWMAASGMPTTRKPGRPGETTTSTSTGSASTPLSVAPCTQHWPNMASLDPERVDMVPDHGPVGATVTMDTTSNRTGTSTTSYSARKAAAIFSYRSRLAASTASEGRPLA